MGGGGDEGDASDDRPAPNFRPGGEQTNGAWVAASCQLGGLYVAIRRRPPVSSRRRHVPLSAGLFRLPTGHNLSLSPLLSQGNYI